MKRVYTSSIKETTISEQVRKYMMNLGVTYEEAKQIIERIARYQAALSELIPEDIEA
jgi:ribosomal protein S17E